jgi:hypothetical protein
MTRKVRSFLNRKIHVVLKPLQQVSFCFSCSGTASLHDVLQKKLHEKGSFLLS